MVSKGANMQFYSHDFQSTLDFVHFMNDSTIHHQVMALHPMLIQGTHNTTQNTSKCSLRVSTLAFTSTTSAFFLFLEPTAFF